MMKMRHSNEKAEELSLHGVPSILMAQVSSTNTNNNHGPDQGQIKQPVYFPNNQEEITKIFQLILVVQ